MQERSIIERLQVLEKKVDLLETLPERTSAVESRLTTVELQLVQLRDEMRGEFSALRMEIRTGDEETRRYMRVLHEEVIARIALMREDRDGG
jgi:hypothetical protein